MATPPSVLALLALICMALLVIPSSAFVPTFPATSHALRLRSARCPMVILPLGTASAATSTLLQMSGGRNTDANHANQLNPDDDEVASYLSTSAGNPATHTLSSTSDDDDYDGRKSRNTGNLKDLWGVWALGI
ncbi:hypothetical protein T484DRAFT_1855432 [Baffinella frigidus]|nr:hypothetical protein T484DRAFT_1855432 [Cryptophyta sp. CCMP2293]